MNADKREAETKALLCDFIVASGGTIATLKDKENAMRIELDTAIVSGFTQTVQNLLAMATKDVKFKDAEDAGYPKGNPVSKDFKSKAGRKYWQQQIGSYRGKIVAELVRRQKDPNKKGAQRTPKDYATKTRELLAEISKRLSVFAGETKTGTLYNVSEAMEIIADAITVLDSEDGQAATVFMYGEQMRRK
jgi:putative IMPACT (imprinted ancient) family translation regulator